MRSSTQPDIFQNTIALMTKVESIEMEREFMRSSTMLTKTGTQSKELASLTIMKAMGSMQAMLTQFTNPKR